MLKLRPQSREDENSNWGMAPPFAQAYALGNDPGSNTCQGRYGRAPAFLPDASRMSCRVLRSCGLAGWCRWAWDSCGTFLRDEEGLRPLLRRIRERRDVFGPHDVLKPCQSIRPNGQHESFCCGRLYLRGVIAIGHPFSRQHRQIAATCAVDDTAQCPHAICNEPFRPAVVLCHPIFSGTIDSTA